MVTEEQIQEEMEEMQEEQAEDAEDNRQDTNEETRELYGAPEPVESYNQHTFLNKAVFDSADTLKNTFLNPEECGRPDFSVRFLLQMKTITEHYINPIVLELRKEMIDAKTEDGKPKYTEAEIIQVENGIAKYFWSKTQNITNSGMSMDGFAMNLNVMRKLEATRKKMRTSSLDNLNKGNRKRA